MSEDREQGPEIGDQQSELTSDIRPLRSETGVRPRWPAFVLALPFLASVLFAYAWFNTDIGRSYPQLSTNNPQPRLWLQARI